MIPHDGTPARRATVVTDGDLPTRLLAFLEGRAVAEPTDITGTELTGAVLPGPVPPPRRGRTPSR